MIYDCKLAIVNLVSRTIDGILMINLIFLPSKLHVPTLSTKLLWFFCINETPIDQYMVKIVTNKKDIFEFW